MGKRKRIIVLSLNDLGKIDLENFPAREKTRSTPAPEAKKKPAYRLYCLKEGFERSSREIEHIQPYCVKKVFAQSSFKI
ncbi:hypothetical protein EB008_06935 [bacterium]|nr:hypothetical protein [bacterium]